MYSKAVSRVTDHRVRSELRRRFRVWFPWLFLLSGTSLGGVYVPYWALHQPPVVIGVAVAFNVTATVAIVYPIYFFRRSDAVEFTGTGIRIKTRLRGSEFIECERLLRPAQDRAFSGGTIMYCSGERERHVHVSRQAAQDLTRQPYYQSLRVASSFAKRPDFLKKEEAYLRRE
jgi:hypothetical protein